MSTWQVSDSGTEVTLDDQGRGEVTFLVTNTGETQDRSVLTITALDGAGESWFTVDEPQRLVPPKETANYLCKVLVPAGTAAGTYALQAVAYSADRDPGETSTTSRRVAITVKPTNGPPPPSTPWWAYVLAAVVLLTVIGVVLAIVLGDDGDGLSPSSQPEITGTPSVGLEVRATTGSWSTPDAELEFGFQWQRCDAAGADCEPIDGETAASYQVVEADIDHTLRVEVTATDGEDTASNRSEPLGPVDPVPLTNTVPPAITGTPVVAQVLTATTGSWSEADADLAFAFQWERCDASGGNCAALGQTSATYQVVPDDDGSTLRVTVTATAAGDLTASAPSQPVGPVVFVRRVRVTVDFNGNDDEFFTDESFDPPPEPPRELILQPGHEVESFNPGPYRFGGEVCVTYVVQVQLLGGGTVRTTADAVLFEGTNEDCSGAGGIAQAVLDVGPGQANTTSFVVRNDNDNEPDTFGVLTLTIENANG